jgi:hypothetical protein
MMSRKCISMLVIAGAAFLTTMLGACSREKELRCSGDSIYLDAGTAGALLIPDDLSVPDSSERLLIPEGGIAAADDESPQGCLEFSPAFRDVE